MQLTNEQQAVMQRLNAVSSRARNVDPNLHSALNTSLIAGFKGIVGWDAETADKAAEVMETILSDFDETPVN